MAGKRPNGTGSVYQRGDGKWVVAVSLDGERVVKYAKTQSEAQRVLAELLVSQQRGTLALPNATTLGEWVDEWLELNRHRLRPSTYRTYQQVLAPVTDLVGDVRLDRLSPLLLTRTFAALKDAGRGERRINLAHTYLKTCLKEAVDLNLIGTNPLERVKKPHWEPTRRDYWTIQETSRFIQAALHSPSKWGPLFAFLTTTGVRISEALGLTWSDVDCHSEQIRIRQALVWIGGSYDVVPPKTKAGRRRVSLTVSALEALNRIPRSLDPHARVFQASTGEPPRPSHLRRYLHAICDAAEVPRINVHGLRHVAAMLALEATDDAYLVQQRLGHSHVSVTIGIYGYSSRKETSVAMAVDKLLSS